MTIQEYNNIKNFTYLEYCDYLQNKYGKAKYDYMTKSFNKNPKVTRTQEGLFAHHKFEDHAIMLGNKEYAMKNPFEWQKADNIIYCDWLEHLLLHILICEYPYSNVNLVEPVGIGGVYLIISQLNDFYSGLTISLEWQLDCFFKIKDDISCYLELIKRFMTNSTNYPKYSESKILASAANTNYSKRKCKNIFSLIKGECCDISILPKCKITTRPSAEERARHKAWIREMRAFEKSIGR